MKFATEDRSAHCYKGHQELLPSVSRRSGTMFGESRSRCWHT